MINYLRQIEKTIASACPMTLEHADRGESPAWAALSLILHKVNDGAVCTPIKRLRDIRTVVGKFFELWHLVAMAKEISLGAAAQTSATLSLSLREVGKARISVCCSRSFASSVGVHLLDFRFTFVEIFHKPESTMQKISLTYLKFENDWKLNNFVMKQMDNLPLV